MRLPWKKRASPPPSPLMSYQAANLQGIGARQQQEDAFAFVNALDVTRTREKGLLAVVADGMGGMSGGKLASETAVSSLTESFGCFDYRQDLGAQLEESVFQAGRMVCQALDGEGGATIVACLLYGGELFFTSVGDSFLFLKRGGELNRLNQLHTVLREKYDACLSNGSFDPERARQDPEAAALTHFLGLPTLNETDSLLKPLPLMAGDVLLLCSDGVGGVLSEEEIFSCLCESTPAEMCAALERDILQTDRRNQDNYTALAVQCEY